MANLKELSALPERLAGGHRLCGGCGASICVRQVLMGAGDADVVCSSATGCLEVSTTVYPYSSWKTPFIHNAFANSAATMSGVEAAYNGLKRAGKIPADKEIKFCAFGGDGGTYDIGLQSLSGAMERGHNMVYVCYDNEAYMNTGIQRSSATPRFADSTTTPVGSVQQGKGQNKKDLTEIMVAHGIPYVAQTTFIGNLRDLHEKSRKAIYTPGAAFLNVLSPCPRGWRYPAETIAAVVKAAVDSCVWPMFEVDHGQYRLTYEPRRKLPVADYMKLQGRFAHCFKSGNEWMLEAAQKWVDQKWEALLEKCSNT